MMKAKLITSLIAMFAAFASAHASQLVGTPCPEERAGTFDQTEKKELLICANDEWQDPHSVPFMRVTFSKYLTEKGAETLLLQHESSGYIGTSSFFESVGGLTGSSKITELTRVIHVYKDHTARVVADIDDDGLVTHVDLTVRLDQEARVGIGKKGTEYRITLAQISS